MYRVRNGRQKVVFLNNARCFTPLPYRPSDPCPITPDTASPKTKTSTKLRTRDPFLDPQLDPNSTPNSTPNSAVVAPRPARRRRHLRGAVTQGVARLPASTLRRPVRRKRQFPLRRRTRGGLS